MKGNCFPFILIILIIFGCIFVKKEDQIREAFGGFKEGFREGQGTFNVRIGSNYRNAPKTVRNVIPAGQTVRFLLNPNLPTPFNVTGNSYSSCLNLSVTNTPRLQGLEPKFTEAYSIPPGSFSSNTTFHSLTILNLFW